MIEKAQKKYWERNELKTRRNYNHPAVKAFTYPKIRIISRKIRSEKKLSLLEVGCGNGFFTVPLSKLFNVKGVDFSERMVKLNPVENCEVQNANNLKEKDESFDAVFCSNLLHHLNKPLRAINEMKRVSRKYVILSEPNRNNPLMFLFSLLKKEERGAIKFSRKYVEKLCRKAKLRIVYSKTTGAIVPNKTPKILVPLLKMFDNIQLIGFYILIIAKK
ncbi:MAG: class I SAM-dependent methyltransferase [Candidatus Woesearchaeota archaeon]